MRSAPALATLISLALATTLENAALTQSMVDHWIEQGERVVALRKEEYHLALIHWRNHYFDIIGECSDVYDSLIHFEVPQIIRNTSDVLLDSYPEDNFWLNGGTFHAKKCDAASYMI